MVGDMNDTVIVIVSTLLLLSQPTLTRKQTTQQLCDLYHSVIASAAVSILGDMINSNPELNTNEKLQEFCDMALTDDYFIYSNTDINDPKVVFFIFVCEAY